MSTHIDYPHIPGYMIGCAACEEKCHCTGEQGAEDCVHCQEEHAQEENAIGERLENVSTHELKSGDIVLAYGMRLLLSGDGTVSTGHPTTDPGPALWWSATILNIDEVREEPLVPNAWIRDGKWTVQGNRLARWTVERYA